MPKKFMLALCHATLSKYKYINLAASSCSLWQSAILSSIAASIAIAGMLRNAQYVFPLWKSNFTFSFIK